MNKLKQLLFLLITILTIVSCKKDPSSKDDPTPYTLVIPTGFPTMNIPSDNALTIEGIDLGRHLFYEKMLSGNNSLSCASCHKSADAFSDSRIFSEGIRGDIGTRNAMALINLGWEKFFFWDGREKTLEEQILKPVTNPIEMDETWPNVVTKLKSNGVYVDRFKKAFGTDNFDSTHVSKAIAQFLRTMISSNSRYDRIEREEEGYVYTFDELAGKSIFFTEKGDCFHCHGSVFLTKQTFNNNGLDASFSDNGLGSISEDVNDNGKFKAPTLRNISLTAPYMHDGRFSNLDEVLNHYSVGLEYSSTVDPLMKKIEDGGISLTPEQLSQLKAFLETFTDYDFINNPSFQDPN